MLVTVRRGYDEVTAIELSAPRADVLRAFFASDPGVTILHGDFESMHAEAFGARFDTILMIAVLEHFVEPISVLRKAHALLVPGGHLVVLVPNIAKWTRRLKLVAGRYPATASVDEGLLMYDRRTPTDLLDEGHLHCFTYRSLTRLLKERAGFRSVVWCPPGRPRWAVKLLPQLLAECCVLATA